MKKIYALMASAAMFSLIACSADGVMDKDVDTGMEQGSVTDKVIAEAEAQRAANTPKSADGCFVSTTSNQVKLDMAYQGITESVVVQDNGSYASITMKSNEEEEIAEFCEEFTEDNDITYNVKCNASTGVASFDVPYEDGIEFDDAAESFQKLCDELNKQVAEEAEKAKEAEEEKNNSSTNQQTSGDDYDWDDDYDDYDDDYDDYDDYDYSDFDWDDTDFEW